MRRVMMIALVLTLLAGNIHAQEGPEYRLRVPTAAEYLQTLSDMLGSSELDRTHWNAWLRDMQQREISLTDVDYDRLSTVYPQFDAHFGRTLRHDRWVNSILMTYWREHPLDLADTQ